MRYTVTLIFPEETLERIPVLAEGFSFSQRVGEQGKHAQQSCTVKVRNGGAAQRLLTGDEYAEAKLYEGDRLVFEGVVKPYVSLTAQHNFLAPITFDILDYTEIMDKYICKDLTKYGAPAMSSSMLTERKWRDVFIKDLISELFTLSGVLEKVQLVLPELPSVKLRYFRLKNGQQLGKCIDQLLYELLLDYRFTPGKVEVFSTYIGNTTPIETGQLWNVLKVDRKHEQGQGIMLEWSEYGRIRSKIYESDTSFMDDGGMAFGGKREGYYYKNEMHDFRHGNQDPPPTEFTADWNFSKLKEKIGGTVDVVDVREVVPSAEVYDETGVTVSGHIGDYDETGGCLYLYYKGTFDTWFWTGWGFKLGATGLVEYRKKQPALYNAKTINPKKISTQYIDNKDLAKRLCEGLSSMAEAGNYKYSFSTYTELQPGLWCSIEDPKVTGLQTVVRIISADYDVETKVWSYTAEGAGKVSVGDIIIMPDTGVTPGDGVSAPLKLYTQRTFYTIEEPDADIIISAYGFCVDKKYPLKWSLNGVDLPETAKEITIRKSTLIAGTSVVICSCIANGVRYEDRLSLIVASGDLRPVIVEYKYSTSSTDPDDDAYRLVYGEYAIKYRAYYLGSSPNPWLSYIPVGPEYEYMYLWKRTWSYELNDWMYELLTPVIRTINIYTLPATYTVSKRQYRDQRILVKVDVKGVKGEAAVTASAGTLEKTPDVANQWTLVIPATYDGTTIKLNASIADVKAEAVLSGIFLKDEPIYNGIGDAPAPEGLIEGDSYMTTAGVPMRWDGTSWQPVKSSDSYYQEIMTQAGRDWVTNGNNIDTSVSALYAFFKNVYATDVVSDSISSRSLKVGDGSNFLFRAADMDKGNPIPPVFDVMYKGQTIFKIEPSSGRIFFGEPNSALNGAASGFMYDPVSQQLESKDKRTIIKADGTLITESATIKGDVEADTLSLKNEQYGYRTKEKVYYGTLNSAGTPTEMPFKTWIYNEDGVPMSPRFITMCIYFYRATEESWNSYVNIYTSTGGIRGINPTIRVNAPPCLVEYDKYKMSVIFDARTVPNLYQAYYIARVYDIYNINIE